METDSHNGGFRDDDVASIHDAFDLVQERAVIAPTPAGHNFLSSGAASPGALARQIYEARRLRSADLSVVDDLFQEPIWDLLLDLYIAHVERREVAVTSACVAANVPATTALRAISALVQRGLVERSNDPDDRRRILLHLSKAGQAAMERYLERF
jgi:DNA-binding MarR family transcriptional regulator